MVAQSSAARWLYSNGGAGRLVSKLRGVHASVQIGVDHQEIGGGDDPETGTSSSFKQTWRPEVHLQA